MVKIKQLLFNLFAFFFVALMLVLSVRGLPGNPTSADLNKLIWKDNGPFELSPERGRYALIYSIVEDHSLDFSVNMARFTSPDVGYLHNNYVSIFAPSVSFLGIPGYIIGKYIGLAQVGTFAWIAMFGLFNVFLIRAIAMRLGAKSLAATIAGFVFLFGTPAFTYAVTLYEHHVSTFLILLGFWLLLRFNSFWSLLLIWFLYAFSFSVDYPNVFLMLPIAVAAFFRNGTIQKIGSSMNVTLSLGKFLAILGIIIPSVLFLWYNKTYYGNPLTLSGTVTRVLDVKANGKPLTYAEIYKDKKPVEEHPELKGGENLLTQFKPRNMINGMYILLVSPDRGTLMFTPVILFGLAGLVLAYRKKLALTAVAIGVIAFDLLLYSMWGDPYGGWSFGARYLIPAYAILAIYIAVVMTYWRKSLIFIVLFFLAMSYSVAVNTLGAVTSNSNPPRIEAEALSAKSHRYVDYTYNRNYMLLQKGVSKSYFYQNFALYYLTPVLYYWIMVSAIILVTGTFLWRFKVAKGASYEV